MNLRDKLILEAVTVAIARTEPSVCSAADERLRNDIVYRRQKREDATRLIAELKKFGLEFAGSDKQITNKLEAPLLEAYTRPAVLMFDPHHPDPDPGACATE